MVTPNKNTTLNTNTSTNTNQKPKTSSTSNNNKSTSSAITSSTNNNHSNNQNHIHHGGACAACRFQRRRCAKDCPLAPYFPANKQQQFLNAHKLFGVHNIVKALQSVPLHLRHDAVKSIIFTADARRRDPVGGCHRIVLQLEHQIAQTQAQLDQVLASLAQAQAQAQSYYQAQSSYELDFDEFGADIKPFVGGHGS